MRLSMDHIVLNVEDEERAVRFYGTILLLPPLRLEEYRKGKVPFPSVRVNADTIIDFFPKKMWEKNGVGTGRTNMNHFCLSMPEKAWLELRQRLADEGVPVEEGPVPRWGAHGDGTSVYFRDPENNLIEARHYGE